MAQQDIYQELTQTIGVSKSTIIPKILKIMVDEDEAKVLLAASPPAKVEALAETSGVDVAKVEKMMDPLFKKGLIFKSKKEDGTRYYRARHLLQFHDASILAPGMPKEFFELWKEYNDKEFKTHMAEFEAMIPGNAIRVIPINVSLEPDTQIAPFEDVKQYVEKAEKIAVTDCTCRLIDGACGKPLQVCIQLNRAAEYALERGTGRELDKQQTMDMLKMCEDEGLVHIVGNSRGLGHVICNCCDDCCINWVNHAPGRKNFSAPSRFTAIVDEEICTACEVCMDRCYFDAISLDSGVSQIDEEKCMGCGLCLITCEVEAISLKAIREEAFVPE